MPAYSQRFSMFPFLFVFFQHYIIFRKSCPLNQSNMPLPADASSCQPDRSAENYAALPPPNRFRKNAPFSASMDRESVLEYKRLYRQEVATMLQQDCISPFSRSSSSSSSTDDALKREIDLTTSVLRKSPATITDRNKF
jgi:hypothetical protein